jgi:glycosyltransferase involved in cell wall biosynthesis/O-antigen/teichoic acid export membrane protein
VSHVSHGRFGAKPPVRGPGSGRFGAKPLVSLALNSGSLVATTGVTSALGAVYWWVAAHQFPAAVVGQAGALISAMTLLGVVGTIGFSTALIPSLAEGRPERGRLVATALTAVGGAGLLLGALWQAAAGRFQPELGIGGAGPEPLLLFAAGVGLTAVTLVLDQALVGLLRGDLQLVRNTVFAVVKLVALAAAGAGAAAGRDAGTIYASWAAGQAASLLVLGVLGARSLALPRLRLLRDLRGPALLHHAFNLALTAPGWILPLEVTVLLSTAANAWFYTAWTVAGFVFVGPIALTTVLYAIGVQPGRGLGRPLRLTLSLSLLWAAGAAGGTFLLGSWALGLFGRAYAAGGTAALLALSLAVFPQVAKLHAVALARLRGRLAPGVALLVAGGALELGLVALGALRGGVTGAAAGWTAAIAVEGAAMAPVIRRALRAAPATSQRRGGGAEVRRVLMVTPRYHPFTGGVETHVHELATRLTARGIEVCVLTTDPTGRLPRRERAGGIEIRRCPAWGWLGDLALAPSLPAALAAEDCDVVHLQGVHTLVAPLALLALRGRRVPLVVTFHSGGHTSRLRTALRPLQWRLLRPGLAAAEGLVAVGEFEAALFARALGVPRARLTVIPNGFELPPAGPLEPEDPDASPLLVSIGRLERYKGHHRVIRALGTVLRAHPRAQLQVVGTGPYERPLRRLAADLAVADRVRFASFPPDERSGLRHLLERADLVALLSEYEAHPVAAAEAAGLGRRVLVADNSGLRELADRGLATAVSLRRTDQELGQAMVDLLGRPAPARPETLAGWDACADRHVELYRCASSS